MKYLNLLRRINGMKLSNKVDCLNNLRRYRIFANETQEHVADILKISVNNYRKIEVNHRYPRADIRRRITEHFNVSEYQMFYQIIERPNNLVSSGRAEV